MVYRHRMPIRTSCRLGKLVFISCFMVEQIPQILKKNTRRRHHRNKTQKGWCAEKYRQRNSREWVSGHNADTSVRIVPNDLNWRKAYLHVRKIPLFILSVKFRAPWKFKSETSAINCADMPGSQCEGLPGAHEVQKRWGSWSGTWHSPHAARHIQKPTRQGVRICA